jgi:hypothetical protein
MRKFLNIPNQEQRKIIDKQSDSVLEILFKEKVKIQEKNKKEVDEIEKHNKICPKCGKTEIIDKLVPVSVNVTDSFHPFTGISSGHSEIQNYAVNHCVACGHEWEKDRVCYNDWRIDRRSYAELFKLYLSSEKNTNGDHFWYDLYLEPYKEFYAESVFKVLKNYVSLSKLREGLKSIYDKK